MSKNVTATVTVIGAGVAGLAAGCALAGAGYDVTLLERRPYVGGRASSYEHPSLGEVVDCQHILLGCCTNLISLLKDSGAADKIRWYDELTFLEPGGRRSVFRPNGLPAPLHYTASFLQARTLGLRDKVAIARGLTQFISSAEPSDEISLAQWFKSTGQTPVAIRNFWDPVVFSALNDSSANCSLRTGAKVFRELFLKSPVGARFGVPTVPLSDLYADAARRLESLGGKLKLRSSVESITQGESGRWLMRTASGEESVDVVVLALPFEQAQKLIVELPRSRAGDELQHGLSRFIHAPYTTVHLWFDRQITDLPHAALLGANIQWFFHKSKIRGYAEERGSYVELIIAGSPTELKMERAEIFERSFAELMQFTPEAKSAKVVKSGILKEARATFSVLPGLEGSRPASRSPWDGIYLAGDWTATGWPSTMESAARSGYLAAEAVAADRGSSAKFLQPDLAASGMMKLFG